MKGHSRLAPSLVAAMVLLSACDQFMMGSGIIHRGQQAPVVHTNTLADVGGDLGRITSYHFPVPGMYRYSEDAALKLGKPLVLEFATPAHCTQCDKQLQLLKMLMRKYGDKVVVLHFDEYYNPEAYRVFKVRGEPWTVLIDRWRTVRRLYPGRTLQGEIDPVLARLVAEKAPPVKKASQTGATGNNG